MKILVTGCQGLIGSSIYHHLSSSYEHVYGACRTNKAVADKHIVGFDLTSEEVATYNLNQINPDVVIHTAAVLPDVYTSERAIAAADKNRLIDQHVIDFCQKNDRTLVYFSGAYVYDRVASNSALTEEATINPEGPYLCQKAEAEGKIIASVPNHLIFRTSSPIGSKMRKENVLMNFLEKAMKNEPITLYGEGERLQNFIYVKEIAQVVEKMVFQKQTGIFNLVSNASVSMKELALLLIDQVNSRSEIVLDVSKKETWVNNNFSNEKLVSALGKELSYTLERAITEIINENRSTI